MVGVEKETLAKVARPPAEQSIIERNVENPQINSIQGGGLKARARSKKSGQVRGRPQNRRR